jgi:anti-sigma factor ChrR (cupin superfamily)
MSDPGVVLADAMGEACDAIVELRRAEALIGALADLEPSDARDAALRLAVALRDTARVLCDRTEVELHLAVNAHGRSVVQRVVYS